MHTAHASKEEAYKQTLKTLEVYKNFIEDYLCMPVLVGEKTENERFAGAVNTYTCEALMQDGQALQCATSHYLGQNFAKAYEVKYQTKDNKFDTIHQSSAGISTRIIGGLIMSHSDDNGIVLPFKIAPIQIAIIVVNANDKATNAYVKTLKKALGDKYRIVIDDSDKSFGFKINKYQIQGVPFCLVVGSQEIEANEVTFIRRDSNDKVKIGLKALNKHLTTTIKQYQTNLYNTAKTRLDSSIVSVNSFEQFKDVINNKKIALAYFDDTVANEKKIKELTGATARCIKSDNVKGKKCFYTGKPATHLIYFARAY
ncbi:MAG: His/Gly/Thr/Pro-type tRNA ligase C-terminal domain-containing protein [Mycoplasmoidaceae bacterium]|nr:His/Gly/Thr/Pro-type tRNA ligase C-terminal domain-containing protein [Mycoplasmoidaceae bacterium]